MILLVDDDPGFRSKAQEDVHLQPIVAAAEAGQANKLVASLAEGLCLAMVDLDLPGINGFDLIRDLKKNHPLLPVIAISGVYSRDVLESARCMGADEVLSKPISASWFAAVQRFRGILHTPGTGNFRCPCGERLLFGAGPGAFTPLADIQRVGKRKQGRCPKCGLLHAILY